MAFGLAAAVEGGGGGLVVVVGGAVVEVDGEVEVAEEAAVEGFTR
ncbi:MAG: hypothetical protein ACRDV4_11170 [Acidimicrobiales bacterium]